MTVKDWRGNDINVGDIVVYPVRTGSSVWMVEGEVVDIKLKKKYYYSTQEAPVLMVRRIKESLWGNRNTKDKIVQISVPGRVTRL